MQLLLPRTDGAVLIEVIVVLVVTSITLTIVWRRRDLRLFVASAGLFLLALMALRALH